MYKSLTPGLWFFLLSLLVVFYPHLFILRKYEKKFEKFFSEKFRLLYFIQLTWMVISASAMILIVGFFAPDNGSYGLAALAMLYASIALPSALFCALTGIYTDIQSKGYDYYEQHKSLLKQDLILSDNPPLKTAGWIQSILLAVIVGISASYILW